MKIMGGGTRGSQRENPRVLPEGPDARVKTKKGGKRLHWDNARKNRGKENLWLTNKKTGHKEWEKKKRG